MPSRIWQFALGTIVYLVFDLMHQDQINIINSKTLINMLRALGLCLLIGSAVYLHSNLVYPGYFAIFPSVGAALVILAGSLSLNSQGYLSQPILVWLGDRSYSLYLCYWPIFMIGFSMSYRDISLQWRNDIPIIYRHTL